jgi:thioredoxin 1
MPLLDTPITTDDKNLKKVLSQQQPVMLILYNGKKDAPLEDAIKKAAKKHAGNLLIVQVDISVNHATYVQYGAPPTPALVTLSPGLLGRKVKSEATLIRPGDIRSHVDHLLHDTPLPEANKGEDSPNPPGAKPIIVSDKTFQEVVLKSKQPVLVDFWAAWCAPCRSIAPVVEQLAKDYQGQVKVAKLDTDANQRIAQQYDIRSIPTFIVFKNGQPVARFSGASPQHLKRMVEDATG